MTSSLKPLPSNFHFESHIKGLSTVYVCEKENAVFFEFQNPEQASAAVKAAKKSWELVKLQLGQPKGTQYCIGYGINPAPQEVALTSSGLQLVPMDPKSANLGSLQELVERVNYWMGNKITHGAIHEIKVLRISPEELIQPF